MLGIHGRGSVDDEDDQVADLPLAHLLAQVLTLELQPLARQATPLLLHGRGGAHGGVDGEVVDLRLRLGAHIPSSPLVRLACPALAALLAPAALARKVDPLDLE